MRERDCVCAKCGKKGRTQNPDPVWCPDCIGSQVKEGERLIKCSVCGDFGIESQNDPAPGICPACVKMSLLATGGKA